MTNTAILVDGGFYQRRARAIWGAQSPEQRVRELYSYCMKHLNYKDERHELYRIFYYDCAPSEARVFHPLHGKQVDLKQTDLFQWMSKFLMEMRKQRKVALRLGKLSDVQDGYTLTYSATKKLCSMALSIDQLSDDCFALDIKQKGVDMKIGLDIASLSYKKQVSQIVLIAGDSDFVSAAKLACREGIDFVLDPMRANISDDLFEHIDGIHSFIPKHS